MNTADRADWKIVEAELDRRGKGVVWLAGKLGYKQPQTVYNWRYRGTIPIVALPAIAALFGAGWTVERLLGLEDQAEQTARAADLSPMASTLAAAFDRISDPQAQLAAYSHCIAVIARACDTPPEPPTARPGQPSSQAPPRNQ